MIRPPRLQPGDTVGLVSPSWGGAGMCPHRVERGVQHLQSLGFATGQFLETLTAIWIDTTPAERMELLGPNARDECC